LSTEERRVQERSKIKSRKPEAKRDNTVSKSQTDFPQTINSPVDQILSLQRTIGNQAVQRLYKSGLLQAKLRIGRPNDIPEREADRVAEQVMRMPETTAISGQHSALSKYNNSAIQMKPT
jgi:hypothetical protein